MDVFKLPVLHESKNFAMGASKAPPQKPKLLGVYTLSGAFNPSRAELLFLFATSVSSDNVGLESQPSASVQVQAFIKTCWHFVSTEGCPPCSHHPHHHIFKISLDPSLYIQEASPGFEKLKKFLGHSFAKNGS